MFFFFPFNTNAPIYHWPFVTIGLIVANVITFFITGMGFGEHAAAFELVLGNGLHPLQWISCAFLHYGPAHLLGNMLFLWGFGIVVEGKLGWWRYLLLYLFIAGFSSMLDQVIMLGADTQFMHPVTGELQHEGAGGASGVIFGLLAIAVIWAPKNELSLVVFYWFILRARIFTAEITYLTFGMWFIGFEVVKMAFLGFQMSSELGHMNGAIVGAICGVLLLELRWVDCEGWDLFKVLKGTHAGAASLENRTGIVSDQRGKRHKYGDKPSDLSQPPPLPDEEDEGISPDQLLDRRQRAIAKIRSLIDNKQPAKAVAIYRKTLHLDHEWQIPLRDLVALGHALYAQRLMDDAEEFFTEYLERDPDGIAADGIKLRLAAIFAETQQRPRAAIQILNRIDPKRLDKAQLEFRKKIYFRAQQRLGEGHIEFEL